MKNTYNITGMTCKNCKATVEEALQSVDIVEKVDVDLESSKAIIIMKKHVSIQVFQDALSNKYTITEDKPVNIFETNSNKNKDKTELRQLFPLFLIFGYITASSILLNYKPWSLSNFMLDFMGLFYIVFSFFKLLDLKGFPESFKMYDPLAKRIPIYGFVYPFIELGLGLLFLMRIEISMALIITLVILGITTIGVTKTLLDKKTIQCACLGTVLKLPMTKATFIENSIMIVMAIVMLTKTY